MKYHVVHLDGEVVGEFSEAEFDSKIFSGELRPDDHFWCEGMTDWQPVSTYRVLAKTIRIRTDNP